MVALVREDARSLPVDEFEPYQPWYGSVSVKKCFLGACGKLPAGLVAKEALLRRDIFIFATPRSVSSCSTDARAGGTALLSAEGMFSLTCAPRWQCPIDPIPV